jgi:transposase
VKSPSLGKERVMHKVYVVDLDDEERESLLELVRKGKLSARKLTRAHALLLAAEGKVDTAIAESLHVHVSTVMRIRRRFVDGGMKRALEDEHRPGAARKLNGKQEALLTALACSKAPAGREHWTMQLLADEMVRLEVVDSLSDETVRRTLKKQTSDRGPDRNG